MKRDIFQLISIPNNISHAWQCLVILLELLQQASSLDSRRLFRKIEHIVVSRMKNMKKAATYGTIISDTPQRTSLFIYFY